MFHCLYRTINVLAAPDQTFNLRWYFHISAQIKKLEIKRFISTCVHTSFPLMHKEHDHIQDFTHPYYASFCVYIVITFSLRRHICWTHYRGFVLLWNTPVYTSFPLKYQEMDHISRLSDLTPPSYANYIVFTNSLMS